MSGFDAGTVVSPLDYTLEPYIGKKGRIKEPSDEQISAFLKTVKEIMVEASTKLDLKLTADASADEMLAVLQTLDPDIFTDTFRDMAGVYSKLCSGDPSVQDLLALPLRVRIRFFEWLQGEVVNPEAGPGAGIAPVTPLKRSAAG